MVVYPPWHLHICRITITREFIVYEFIVYADHDHHYFVKLLNQPQEYGISFIRDRHARDPFESIDHGIVLEASCLLSGAEKCVHVSPTLSITPCASTQFQPTGNGCYTLLYSNDVAHVRHVHFKNSDVIVQVKRDQQITMDCVNDCVYVAAKGKNGINVLTIPRKPF